MDAENATGRADDDRAKIAAQYVSNFAHNIHRGVWQHMDHEMVAFGCDAYGRDPRSKYEVEQLRVWCHSAGVEVRGFGVSDDGDAWAMILCTGMPVETLQSQLQAIWDRACELFPRGTTG